jgi:hypothetical protein
VQLKLNAFSTLHKMAAKPDRAHPHALNFLHVLLSSWEWDGTGTHHSYTPEKRLAWSQPKQSSISTKSARVDDMEGFVPPTNPAIPLQVH